MNNLLQYFNVIGSFVILILFAIISAYVKRFNIKRSGLSQDYVVFAIMIIIALKMGGAI